ncbi:phage tail protein [Sinorhizobium medicae]|uniref:D-alanyl-D-alanine carboxypeptidase family protein n=1 Tax=Sinorhizobium medicae TaxID=110321 RepID=UPI000FD91BFD|nr:D-alanyl-D-alanine carboxypeptidase family protein [Sinorhizobium medicae]MDX0438925.1 phage tail protein [Sinorhizobium medicae]MDX0652737.1 phage tail protein [Sinorhizobium medicae]MDX1156589.1 phage tail protein [Sinorhizobium medicae]RVJ03263.1 phage tail protein [Sinorhizobium medicae]
MTPEETRLVLQIEANVKSLERAMRQGGIIVDRTTKAMNDNYANVGRNVDRVNRQIEASTRNATRNLGFQFQDISTQLLSGTSPFTIMAQQASQAGTAIDDLRRSGGVLKGIGGALGGLFSPGALGVSAAILGFGYLAQAAQEYFEGAEEGSEEANKEIAAQRDLIRQAAAEWGNALPALRAYNDELERLEGLERQRKGLAAAIEDAEQKQRDAIALVDQQLQDTLKLFERFPQKAQEIGEVVQIWETLKQKVADNTISVADVTKATEAFNEVIGNLPLQGARDLAAVFQNQVLPMLDAAVRRTQDLIAEQKQMAQAAQLDKYNLPPLDPLNKGAMAGVDQNRFFFGSQTEFERAGEQAGAAWSSGLRKYLSSDKPLSSVTELDPEFQSRLAEFLAAAQEQAGNIVITSGARSIERQAQLWQQALEKYGSEAEARKWVAPPGRSQHNHGRAADLQFESDAVRDWAHAHAESYGLVFRLQNESWHIELKRDEAIRSVAAATDESTAASYRKADADRQLTAGQREYVAELQRRSDAEREQAAAAQQYSNIAQSSFSAFIDDLRSGTSVADAFRGALDRVIDGIINMTIQAMFASRGFENLFSQLAGFGGFGGLGQFGIAAGGGIGLYHGGGIVGPGHGPRRNVSPLLFANAPRLHNGLLPGEFPAILQRGEMVIPRSMVKRGGGTMIDNSQTSYGDVTVNVPGQVVASSDEGKRLGILINRAVERVLVSEGRPGGILRRTPQ